MTPTDSRQPFTRKNKMQATATEVKQVIQKTQQSGWLKVASLILVGFFVGRLLSFSSNSPAPVAEKPVVAATQQPSQPTQLVVQPPAAIIVQQATPQIVVQQPTVTVLQPAETIVVRKSYPNRTIVIERPPTVVVE